MMMMGQNLAIFLAKIIVLGRFGLYLTYVSINLPSFWYVNCSYRLL